MRKKLRFSFIAIGLSVAMVVSTAISQGVLFTNANETDYYLKFDPWKNTFHSTSGTAVSGSALPKTENANFVLFTYSNLFIGDSGSWHILSGDGSSFFYNENPLNGLKSVSIGFKDTYDQTFKIYWSNTTEFDNEHCQEYTSQTSPIECIFEDEPTHVKIENTSGSQLKISNVDYKYSCVGRRSNVSVSSEDYSKGYVTGDGSYVIESTATISAIPLPGNSFSGWYQDETLVSEESSYSFIVPATDTSFVAKFTHDKNWDKTHGVNPIISGDNKTLTYGLYPQTIVSNPEKGLIETAQKYSDETYFPYNNEYYVKDTGNPVRDDRYFSDGTLAEKDKTYYFKCEQIKWNVVRIVSSDKMLYTLDCCSILYGLGFNEFIYKEVCNLYSNSSIRTWLNNDFYNHAFSLSSPSIRSVDLEDVGVTDEKLWLGSKTEYLDTWYSSHSDREKKVTDFALCNHADNAKASSPEAGNGTYWTRTPDPDVIYNCYVGTMDGYIAYTLQVNYDDTGVSPCTLVAADFY